MDQIRVKNGKETIKNRKFTTYLIRILVYYIMLQMLHFPAGNYMFKVNNRNTRTRCEICSKLTIKTPERRH